MKKIFLPIAIALPFSVFASSNTSCDGDTLITNIYFSNGVATNSTSAMASLALLKSEYKGKLESITDEDKYRFYQAFNPTQGMTIDIIQVLHQKLLEQGIADEGITSYQFYRLLAQEFSLNEFRQFILVVAGLIEGEALAQKLTDEMLIELREFIVESSARAMSDSRYVNDKHLNYYQSDLTAGKRVIVMAHSQGNMFTNHSYNTLLGREAKGIEGMAVIGIASPAATNIGRTTHITAHDDRVIDLLRLIHDVLPSNIENDPGFLGDFRSTSNHYFEQDYMDERLASKAKIDQALYSLVDSLPYPDKISNEGAIRATLTWSSSVDVDLHAFEPDGNHIFFKSMWGESGELDLDNEDGFGPENIYVDCEKIMEGVYEFGVDYYIGASPTIATLSLYMGDDDKVLHKSKVLESDRDTTQYNPSILYRVNVNKDADGVITMELLE